MSRKRNCLFSTDIFCVVLSQAQMMVIGSFDVLLFFFLFGDLLMHIHLDERTFFSSVLNRFWKRVQEKCSGDTRGPE